MTHSKHSTIWTWTGIICMACLCLLAGGCSDSGNGNGTTKDAAVETGALDRGVPDGYQLWPCDDPGQSCNAHDPCAIDPICGEDRLCYPTKLQSCDDGLDCTEDICKGMGLCTNTPKEGACALPVLVGGAGGADGGTGPETTEIRCFQEDEKNPDDPCQLCKPEESTEIWIGANGGACDDKDDCTKDDYCQAGVCKGVNYAGECDDEISCTENRCDGKGGCILPNPLKDGWCLINGLCAQDGEVDALGCGVCDVSQSQTEWTPLTEYCKIDGKCYKPGDKDSAQCMICDPQKNPNGWTPIPGLCKINATCYTKGDTHSGGCAECDPDVSATAWTVTGDNCLIENVCKTPGEKDTTGCGECNPAKSKIEWTPVLDTCLIGGTCYQDQQKDDTGCLVCLYAQNPTGWTTVAGAISEVSTFEGGNLNGWTITNSDQTVGWQLSTSRSTSGTTALYYGDPATGTFDSGSTNSGTATMPGVTLTAGKQAGLSFMLYMDTEASASYDQLKVKVGTTELWEKDTNTVIMDQWQEITVDLSSFAGQTITITFDFDSVDSALNSGEGIYIDDITIFHNC